MLVGGEEVDLDQERKDEIIGDAVVKKFAAKCYRTLLVAYSDYSLNEWETLKRENDNLEDDKSKEVIENGLVLAGIFGLMDPLRPGIRDAVIQCHKSGVNVRMCTGDNIDTATAISLEAGIISEVDLLHNEDGLLCMTGQNFREAVGGLHSELQPSGKNKDSVRNMAQFRKICKKLKVLARSSPEDKYLLVTGLKDMG